jgi:hypothetical protein
MGWADVVTLAQQASRTGRLADRRVAAELAAYLRGVADMRDTTSNEVYVVSLTPRPWPGWPADLTPIDVVVRHGLYFFPATGTSGWPKTPPNYVAFRYHGRLQAIHHVDDAEIIENPYPSIPGAPDAEWGGHFNPVPHFLLTLGPAIRPPHEVRTGRVFRASRVKADIDLLLTSSTISEAAERSRARRPG